jgi:hypothetical protein
MGEMRKGDEGREECGKGEDTKESLLDKLQHAFCTSNLKRNIIIY